MPKDARRDSSQQNGDQDKQSHNQMLSTGIRTEGLLPPTHETELMQPGPSGIQNLGELDGDTPRAVGIKLDTDFDDNLSL